MEDIKKILKNTFIGGSVLSFRFGMTLASVGGLIYYLSSVNPELNNDFSDSDDLVALESDNELYDEEGHRYARDPSSSSSSGSQRQGDSTALTSSKAEKDFFRKKENKENVVNGGGYRSGRNSESFANSDSNYQDSASNNRNRNPSNNTDSNAVDGNQVEGADSTVSNTPLPSSTAANNTSPEDETETTIVDSSPTPSTLNCSVDMAEGIYGASIAVTITCSETANIFYCVQAGGGFCDPFSSSTAYVAPINLNAGDNTYAISFYAEAVSSSFQTEITDLTYVINSVPPAIVANFPVINVQTTEVPFMNNTQSTDFGKADHYYHQVNFKTHDPIGLGWSCEDIKNNYAILVTPSPVSVQADFDVSGLLASSQIDQAVDMARLSIGDNYIATIIEDRSRNLFSCQVQNVTVIDFYTGAFTSTGSTAVAAGVRTTAGGFTGFGHFQVAPNSALAGATENLQAAVNLKTNFFSINY